MYIFVDCCRCNSFLTLICFQNRKMETLNFNFIKNIFVLIILVLTTPAFSWKSNPSSIKLNVCNSLSQLVVMSVGNGRSVISRQDRNFSGWVEFSKVVANSEILTMYGIEKNDEWFFMGVTNRKIKLIKGIKPVGQISLTDPRLFRFQQSIQSRHYTLYHVATRSFVSLGSTRSIKAILTQDVERAACIDKNA